MDRPLLLVSEKLAYMSLSSLARYIENDVADEMHCSRADAVTKSPQTQDPSPS